MTTYRISGSQFTFRRSHPLRLQDLLGTGQVISHYLFFPFTIKGNKGPAAARSIKTLFFGVLSIFAEQITKIVIVLHGRFLCEFVVAIAK